MCSGSSKACLRALPDSQHDQVDDLVLAVQDQVVQAQQDRRAVVERGARPRGLGTAGPRERLLDVGLARLRDDRERRAVERGVQVTPVPVVAISRSVSAATYSGSNAYDARGSCSGSCGPSTTGPPEGTGFLALMNPSVGGARLTAYRLVTKCVPLHNCLLCQALGLRSAAGRRRLCRGFESPDDPKPRHKPSRPRSTDRSVTHEQPGVGPALARAARRSRARPVRRFSRSSEAQGQGREAAKRTLDAETRSATRRGPTPTTRNGNVSRAARCRST